MYSFDFAAQLTGESRIEYFGKDCSCTCSEQENSDYGQRIHVITIRLKTIKKCMDPPVLQKWNRSLNDFWKSITARPDDFSGPF